MVLRHRTGLYPIREDLGKRRAYTVVRFDLNLILPNFAGLQRIIGQDSRLRRGRLNNVLLFAVSQGGRSSYSTYRPIRLIRPISPVAGSSKPPTQSRRRKPCPVRAQAP